MRATTIDEVIQELDEIIVWAGEKNSRAGYFAALYRKVTVAVKAQIAAGYFEDGPRMERLDVLFANRYLDAFRTYRAYQPTTKSWKMAYDALESWPPIVMQHLLVGMNAHINLDLGIAAAAVAPGDALPALRTDFNRINTLLAGLVAEVQTELAQVWPPLRWLLALARQSDDVIVNFSMTQARDAAWRNAERLAPLTGGERDAAIAQIDATVAGLADRVLRPGGYVGAVVLAIRLFERGEPREIAGRLH
ncbi:MAG: hypothetical protein KBG20_10920 [Caldilineaceae bacterium]|nr:hypothetical protein [Caldilineaceae bacterium]MBP8107200.1 hypothetical protein [Caldilineaceae bacterium]MBP8122235.1 hypothetical protein [Caldilineaceae bacterium]MBP9072806.1 hypothetical protein [Caldilineaceae bacterium]